MQNWQMQANGSMCLLDDGLILQMMISAAVLAYLLWMVSTCHHKFWGSFGVKTRHNPRQWIYSPQLWMWCCQKFPNVPPLLWTSRPTFSSTTTRAMPKLQNKWIIQLAASYLEGGVDFVANSVSQWEDLLNAREIPIQDKMNTNKLVIGYKLTLLLMMGIFDFYFCNEPINTK